MPAAAEVDLALRIIDQATGPLNRVVGSVNQGFSKITSMARMVEGALGGITFGIISKEALEMADRMTLLSARLDLVGGRMAQVHQVAQQTGASLAATAELYVRTARAVQDYDYSQEQVLEVTKAINQAMIVSGANATEAKAAIIQLSQGLASGVLRGQEFNSVAEQAPRLLDALSESLGKTRGELRAMAKEGQLTTDVVMKALLEQSQNIEAEFEKMPMTIGRAMTELNNSFQMFVADINEGMDATSTFATLIDAAAHALDGMRELIGALGPAFTEAWEYAKAFFLSIKEYITAIENDFKALGEIIKGVFTFDLDRIKAGANQFVQEWRDANQKAEGLFKGAAKKSEEAWLEFYHMLKEEGKEASKSHVDHAKKTADAHTKTLKPAVDETVKAMKRLHDIEMELFPDSEIGRIQRIHAHFQDLREEITDLAFALNMELDEYERFMDMVDRKEDEQVEKVHSASSEIVQTHHEAIQEVSRGWENAYNQITNFLEDWISGSKSIVSSFIDWIKHAFAQLAATSIVGSIAGGLGLPGASSWAGQGMSLGSVASGAGGIWNKIQAAGGIGSWLMGGLTGAGNTLMYGVPEALLSMGFEDTAFALGSMPSSLMGGLTAGIGTFLMQGLFSGDWAKAAVSGGTTGLGAGIGALAGGPVGAVVGGLIGALGGGLLGGLFGDGTERTYLQQAMTTSYGPGGFRWGEPRTRRWDRGEPDWMDEILEIQGQLQDQLKGLFDGVVDTLSKLTPELKSQLAGWSGDFLMSWSAETKDEVQEDLEKNIQNFARYELSPVIETFKEDLAHGISGLDLSLFTDEFKQGFTDHIQQLMDKLDISSIDSIQELEQALKDLGATVDEIQGMEDYVQKVQQIREQFESAIDPMDAYHRQLKNVDQQFQDTIQALVEMGVDLEKMPELYQAWAKAIDDLKLQIFGFILDVPEKFDEEWINIIHDISQLDLGGKLVELLNQALDDPSRMQGIGQDWAQWLGDSMKSSVLSGAMTSLMDQVEQAYIQPIMQSMIGSPFGAEGIMSAFTQIDEAIPQLAQAGQSMADVFGYIQQTGGLEGFNWDAWNEQYGALWDDINQRNQEAAAQMDAAARAHQEAAMAQQSAAQALASSAGDISAAASRIQTPPPVYVTVEAGGSEANLG